MKCMNNRCSQYCEKSTDNCEEFKNPKKDCEDFMLTYFTSDSVVIKQLSLEELREQFESGYSCNKKRDENGYYYDLDLNDYWDGYVACARANNIIKDGE